MCSRASAVSNEGPNKSTSYRGDPIVADGLRHGALNVSELEASDDEQLEVSELGRDGSGHGVASNLEEAKGCHITKTGIQSASEGIVVEIELQHVGIVVEGFWDGTRDLIEINIEHKQILKISVRAGIVPPTPPRSR